MEYKGWRKSLSDIKKGQRRRKRGGGGGGGEEGVRDGEIMTERREEARI